VKSFPHPDQFFLDIQITLLKREGNNQKPGYEFIYLQFNWRQRLGLGIQLVQKVLMSFFHLVQFFS